MAWEVHSSVMLSERVLKWVLNYWPLASIREAFGAYHGGRCGRVCASFPMRIKEGGVGGVCASFPMRSREEGVGGVCTSFPMQNAEATIIIPREIITREYRELAKNT